jgi:acyl-coenzyme A synthetase/AMP-(fatty) acid ligase
VQEFPTSPAGKILRRELRRIVSNENTPAQSSGHRS